MGKTHRDTTKLSLETCCYQDSGNKVPLHQPSVIKMGRAGRVRGTGEKALKSPF